jgi:hypothetical protein
MFVEDEEEEGEREAQNSCWAVDPERRNDWSVTLLRLRLCPVNCPVTVASHLNVIVLNA